MRGMRAILILGVVSMLLAGPAPAGTIKGKVTIPHVRTLADIVVYLDRAPGQFPPSKQHAVMNQKNLTFVPHVLPVVVGTTVDFLNGDQVLHNVFTPDKCANKFNLGTWPKGQFRSFTFDKVGCSPVLLCNVHPEMEGFIVVLQNPYFAVTDKTGLYKIADVPGGTYTLRVWNRKTLDVKQEVTVPKEEAVTSDIILK
jgi:plastocyanin